MSDSFDQTKRELYGLMQRMRHSRIAPPTPGGVTPLEARTMMAVFEMRRCHGETRPGRIAEFAHTTPSALSQTFKSLEEKGLIERHRFGDDYRGITVSLTDEGERLAAEGRKLHSAHMDEVMASIGEEDVRHLARILRKVVEFHEGANQAAACEGSVAKAAPPASDPASSAAEGGDVPCA